MCDIASKSLVSVFIAGAFILALPTILFGQICLNDDDVNRLIAQTKKAQNVTENKDLKREILKLREEAQKFHQKRVEQAYNPKFSQKEILEKEAKQAGRFCQIIKEYGWLNERLVGTEGTTAASWLLISIAPFELQRTVLPLISMEVDRGDFKRENFAMLVDKLLLRVGRKQLFGTQAEVIDGIITLFPIEREKTVDQRRNKYNLLPLAEYLKNLEIVYRMPLIKSPLVLKDSQDIFAGRLPTQTLNSILKEEKVDEEVIRVETNLVNLNVSVISKNPKANVKTLAKKDFMVFENGSEQSIEFFAETEVPFDLVLLLDLSGSTSGKRDLIRKSTTKFIESARPADRIAVVTFTSITKVVSPLTQDRNALLQSVAKIDETGGSNVWDALHFALTEMFETGNSSRRKAIVLMTDGMDISFFMGFRNNPQVSFSDLVDTIRRDDTIILPIYLDTESSADKYSLNRREYTQARRTLALFAEESGGYSYSARRVEDLEGVYEQVINDLGLVYSIGYKPTNEKRDGTWRNVTIQIPNRPDLSFRTRRGYYAN